MLTHHWRCTAGHEGTFTDAQASKTTDPAAAHLGTSKRPGCGGAVVTSLSASLVKRVGEKWGAA